MECKFSYLNKRNQVNIELIDTLWNVNDKKVIEKLLNKYELIDTLWNVNRDPETGELMPARINRYIMECKF